MNKKIWNKKQDSLLECFNRGADIIKEAGKPSSPKEHSERTEFLSRQHVDFKTTEGIKQLLQTVTWRVKIEIVNFNHMNIYVRKKKIPVVRRLAKEFGLVTIHYKVKEIGWFECWFKRFQYFENQIQGVKMNQWCALDHGFTFPNKIFNVDKNGDMFERIPGGKPELVDMKIIKPEENK